MFPDIQLANPSRYAHVNDYVCGLIGIFEAAFPGRVRAYYLVGSFATDEAIAVSDVDMRVVFKGAFEDDERARAERLVNDCRAISALPLDLPLRCEDDLMAGREDALSITRGGLFLYGEDIRDRLPLPPLDDYIRLVTGAAYRNSVVRYRGRPTVRVPLDYPDPDGTWFGYDVSNSTQHLVVMIGWAATATVAIQAGQYVARKSDWSRLYREHIADEWTPFLTTLYETCRNRWAYAIPADPADRVTLRDLCRHALGFEDHYCAVLRDYCLVCLESDDGARVRWALEACGRFIYDDADVRAAVAAHLHSDDANVRAAAQHTLALIDAALA